MNTKIKKLNPKFIATIVIPAMIASGELASPISVFADNTSGTESAKSGAVTITKQPQDQRGLYGATVKFHIAASGTNLSYKWQCRYTGDESGWFDTKITGYNTDTLIVPINDDSKTRLYRCIVTGDGQSATSNAVSLTAGNDIDDLLQSEGAYAYQDESGHRIIYITAEDIRNLASTLDKVHDSIALNYSSTTAYKDGDYCYFAGKIYKCTKDCTGKDPTDKTYWRETTVTKEFTTIEHDIDLLKETVTKEVVDALTDLGSNFAGIYDANVSVSYQPGQLVMFDNVLYKCISATTSGDAVPGQSGAWQKTTVSEQISLISNSIADGRYTLATTIAAKNGTDLRSEFTKDANGIYTSSATFDEINQAIASIPTQVTINNVKNGNISLIYHYHVNSDTGDTTNKNDPSRKSTETSTTKGGCYQTPHYYYKYTRTVPEYTYFTGYEPVVSAAYTAVYHDGYESPEGSCGYVYSAWGYHEYYATHYYDTDYSSCHSWSVYVAGYTSYIEYYFVSGYTPVYQTKASYTEVGYGNGYSVPKNFTSDIPYQTEENETANVTASTVYTTDQILYELACGKQDGQIVKATVKY